jgi:Trypsin-like peptidase domain/RDD family
LCAAIVDGFVLIACWRLLMWLGLSWWVVFLVWLILIEVGYQLGGSVGKRFVGISVPVKNRFQLYLRETAGKLASLSIFGIGFLMIFSRERLGLHDYMAKTKVLRRGTAARLQKTLVSVAAFFVVGTWAFLSWRSDRRLPRFSPWTTSTEPSTLGSVIDQMPAVVTVYVHDDQGKLFGQGSGFLITSDGVGVTNFHVIKGASSADVKLGDGRLYHLLAVHAYNEDRDIAIFQLGRKMSLGTEPAVNLPYLALSSEEVRVGDRITAVGSPEGLSNSLSDGLVSAIRTDGAERFLQITAPVSPGSSGGPVFNLKGQVVAVTSFQFSDGQNLNFAIPIKEVSEVSGRRANLPLGQLYALLHKSEHPRAIVTEQPSGHQGNTINSEPSAALTGRFSGTVHNLSVDRIAQFSILVEEQNGIIQGCFEVTSPLYGSGPLQGNVNGGNVQFDVTSPSYFLQFKGRRSGKALSGTYTASVQGGNETYGEFVLEQVDSENYLQKFEFQTNCPSDAELNH